MHVSDGINTYRFDESDPLDQGKEALIYKVAPDRVIKLFRAPEDPLYVNRTADQRAARRRIRKLQQRLDDFPAARMPHGVVTPLLGVYANLSKAEILGYLMPYVQDSFQVEDLWDRRWLKNHPEFDKNWVVNVFRSLHHIVSGVHAAGAVIGDLSGKNVLVNDSGQPHLVDVDGMGFGQHLPIGGTRPFVDHLIYDYQEGGWLSSPSEESDWYSYLLMLCWAMLHVRPYGGVYRENEDTLTVIAEPKRIARRISILHPRVEHDKKPFQNPYVLPDDFIDFMRAVFEEDHRGPFPLELLDEVRWTICKSCGLHHARPNCPAPGCDTPGVIRPLQVSREGAKSQTVFRANATGRILSLAMQGGELNCLYYEDGIYYRANAVRSPRSDRQEVMAESDVDSPAFEKDNVSFFVQGPNTLMTKDGIVIVMGPDGQNRAERVDVVDGRASLAVNGMHRFWVKNGYLIRDDHPLQSHFAEVGHNVRLWLGENLGFGFSRSRNVTRGFMFDPLDPASVITMDLPTIPGAIEEANCVFDNGRVWLMVVTRTPALVQVGNGLQTGRRTFCYVISRKGKIIAKRVVRNDDYDWLSGRVHGHAPTGNGSLLVATNDGICQYGASNGSIILQVEYPETAIFVGKGTRLLRAAGRVYASSDHSIRRLQFPLVTVSKNTTESGNAERKV